MTFKHSVIYTAILASIAGSALAQSKTADTEVLEQINVVSELEKAKAAGDKQKEIVNLSLQSVK